MLLSGSDSVRSRLQSHGGSASCFSCTSHWPDKVSALSPRRQHARTYTIALLCRPVTCFKLMVKGSCEGREPVKKPKLPTCPLLTGVRRIIDAHTEKILAAGKKKLVLEHLIVSSLNTEDREKQEIENVLQFGAKELFEQGDGESASDIKYNDADVSGREQAAISSKLSDARSKKIDNLLEQSRKAVEDADKAKSANTDNKAFSYAKVWEKQGGLSELEDKDEDGADAEEQRGFWAAVRTCPSCVTFRVVCVVSDFLRSLFSGEAGEKTSLPRSCRPSDLTRYSNPSQQAEQAERDRQKALNMGRGRRQRKNVVRPLASQRKRPVADPILVAR